LTTCILYVAYFNLTDICN